MRIFKCLFVFSVCVFSFASGFELKPSNINILLKENATEALLEVRGPYYIFNPADKSKIGSGILEKRFIIRPTSMGIRWGQEFPGIRQMLIVPRSSKTSILVDGIQYDGAISIYKVKNKINVINAVDIEKYLKSYLTTKFQFPLEHEAMAAIAIAARTTAYCQVSKSKAFWHIKAKDVEYAGASIIIPDSSIVNAVDSTHHLILVNSVDEKMMPFAAPFTEHCAGKTAAFHSIFRKDFNSPREGVEVMHAALDREESRWSYSISKQRLASIFNMKKLTNIKLFQDASSKKIYAIRFFNGEKFRDVDFFSLQRRFGRKFIKSNDFSSTIQGSEVHFVGYGSGHGVGLCLYSTSAMAQNGATADKILAKFFKNTSIINVSKQ